MVQHHLLTSIFLATSDQGLSSPKPTDRASGKTRKGKRREGTNVENQDPLLLG